MLAALAAAWLVQPAGLQAQTVEWKMTGVVNSGAQIAERIAAVSAGTITIKAHEPGKLFAHFDLFDAIGDGRVDLGAAPVGFWSKKIPAAPLFSAVPFGPAAPEYLAWLYHGGGQTLLREILYGHGIHPILCSISAPEASGWFNKKIESVDDLSGLKMRFFGLGAQVMQKFGVQIQRLPPNQIYAALESGQLDATEFSSPAVDLNLGFQKVRKHYYFPGWHQPYTLWFLMINQDSWRSLSGTQQAQVEAACSSNLVATLAWDEAKQFDALEKVKAQDVQLHRWSPAMLRAFHSAWREVAAEMSAKHADFKRVWASLSGFRTDYAIWRELAVAD